MREDKVSKSGLRGTESKAFLVSSKAVHTDLWASKEASHGWGDAEDDD